MRPLALLLGVFIVLLATVRLQIHTDGAQLLPRDEATARTLDAAAATAGAQRLFVELDGTGVSREALSEAVQTLAVELRALPLVTEVRTGPVENELLEVGRRLDAHTAAFVPTDVLRVRLSPEGLDAVFAEQRSRMNGFMGMFLEDALRTDPLDLRSAALDRLTANPLAVQSADGLLLDAEGTRALLLVRVNRHPGSVRPGDPEITALAAVLSKAPLPVRWFGGVRVASETATAIEADVRRTSLVGVVLLGLLLVIGFRGWRPVLAAGPMVFAAGGGAVVGAWLSGPIHAIQLGFGAALAGLAVDYWIHLLLTARPEEPGSLALRRLLPALTLSAGSTVVGFLLLSTSPLPVVRVLGFTGVGATVGAWLGVVLLGPSLLGWAGRVPDGPLPVGSRPTLWVIGLVGLGLLGMQARFDPDPMTLLAAPEAMASDQAWFASHYRLGGPRAFVFLDGADALDRSTRVQHALDQLGITPTEGPASVRVGAAERADKSALLTADLQVRIDEAAARHRLGPFPGAADRLTAQLGPVPDDLWAGTLLAERAQLEVPGALVSLAVPDPTVLPAFADTLASVDPAPLVVPTALTQGALAELQAGLLTRGTLALAAVFGLLTLWTRSPGRALALLTPVLAAVTAASGVMVLAGVPWNPVSLAALVPVMGLAVDYGVFAGDPAGSRRAIALSAATTCGGFAALLLADSPALAGVGLATLAGVGAAASTALFVLPALLDGRWPSPGWRPWLGRLALAAVVLLHLDLGIIALLAFKKPAIDVPFDCDVVRDGAGWRCGPARLLRTEGITVLTTAGPPYQVGVASAKVTTPLRTRVEEELFESFERLVPFPPFRTLITRGSLLLGANLDQHIDPEHLLEIRGDDDITPETAWFRGPSYTRRVFYHALHDLGQALVDSPLLACTGFVAGGTSTADGHWLLARNFDFEGGVAFDRDKIVRVHRPDRGIPYLSVAFGGLVGAVSGVNQAGIAVAINASGSDDPPRPGTPMTLIVREILQHASTLDDAERILRARSGFVSENLLVVDADHQRAAVFELTPSQVVRIDVHTDRAVANHFRSPVFTTDQTNLDRQRTTTTVPRLQRMEELLDRHRGALDPDVALEILTDTRAVGDVPLAPGHRHALDAHIATHGLVIDATTRTVRVSRFPNLSAGFVEVRLDDLLHGQLEAREVRAPRGDAEQALAARRARESLRAARRSRLPTALGLTEQALRDLPDHPEALYERGRMLHAAGDPAARPLLERALAAPPEYPYQTEAIRVLLEEAP